MEAAADDDNYQKNKKKDLLSSLSSSEYITTIRRSPKPTPPPFLEKTYKVVEDPATDDVISWNTDGTAFVVWQTAEFARDLLPTLFKHCNFSSFVRQLNTYGFRKVTTGRWEFYNEMFQKGKRELLCNIRRRKTWTHNRPRHHAHDYRHDQISNCLRLDQEDQRSSSTSSSSGYSTLVNENRRLKKENGILTTELMNTKKKCKELLQLVEKCKEELEEDEEEDDDDEDDDDGVKLFGVRL